ncbi:hypothetical protein B7495_18050 (plasmid) [Cryobacterium sp. LW097]|nr:hypothetical protein B7495_18050 [Cryobacterium sp. LW097]TFC56819.1 hypothetical protein E3O60_16860 [Cryobacterium sp. TMB1-7]TFC57908.1 hypothetical protein E3O68_02575 [Cryobacterium sp. TMB3-1-2]TFC70093.1 hypothetical protein E3T21_11000 [Cryobacterium sp. TMB3-15]TFC75463.1 hypothetical protein E3T22_12620 [Cryobacterium sp. TMB3-10]TFD38856.1 hypothetical protein E3T58_16250 [Cryobacterium sp. TMB3-12]
MRCLARPCATTPVHGTTTNELHPCLPPDRRDDPREPDRRTHDQRNLSPAGRRRPGPAPCGRDRPLHGDRPPGAPARPSPRHRRSRHLRSGHPPGRVRADPRRLRQHG